VKPITVFTSSVPRANESSAKLLLTSFADTTVNSGCPMYLWNVTQWRDPSCVFQNSAVKDGRSSAVREWIKADPRVTVMLKEIEILAEVHLVAMKQAWLSIGFMDHHGKWIAPAIAELVADHLGTRYATYVGHRELK